MTKKHADIIARLATFQSNEKDARESVRESQSFLFDKDGQWEENAVKAFSGKPRYQFDRVYPVITSICGEIQDIEFGARVVEASAGARPEIAKTYDGMLRSIQNLSKFEAITANTAKRVVASGFDAWQIVSDWGDVDAFEQDLLIEQIPDAVNRVWLGPTEKVDHSDCKEAFVLTAMSRADYEADFPKGSGQSVGSDSRINFEKADCDDVVVADYFWIEYKNVTLHLLSNDKVVRADQFDQVAAAQAEQGVTIVRSRTRKLPTCYVRRMDGADWLNEKQATPFAYIPVVPVYGHYELIAGKRVYFGVTEKLKDAQRIYNYAKSREISDGALAPTEKIAMTEKQAEGHELQNSTLNNDSRPIFKYNHDALAPPPYKLAGNQPNAGLAMTQQGAAQDIVEISSSFSPARGQGMSNHSGAAYEMLQSKSNLSAIDYINAMKLAVELAAKILVDAIPKVYDTRNRQVRLLNEDGSSKFESINEETYPPGQEVQVLRDLSQGHYDACVTTGPAFTSRKNEGVKAMMDIAQIYPEILQSGADVLIKSIDAPYIEQIGERVRAKMIEGGLIPESQLTDEERQKITEEMQAKAQQGPDPMEQATLQAIMAEVQRANVAAQAQQQDMQVQMMEQMRKMQESMAKIGQIEADTQHKQSLTVENLSQAQQQYSLPGTAANDKAQEVARSIG